MKHPGSNIFAAWFFMMQTLAMGWVAAAGNLLLEMLGVPVHEGDVPGRLVGALLLLLLVYLAWHFMRGLPPQGKPGGNGYRIGHRLLLAGNILAGLLFVFHFFAGSIDSYNTHLVLNTFTTSFGYFAMGCFAIGFSLIYQSALPQEEKKN
ncbi:hypothetical protein MIZ01_1891 [Sideroxyarcus emersonii]|uniref:Uncharacterized protein n=1 Tax=Sideroxyarcus emersonii TaxID=2764705 RepID=A0AAN1XAV1_9PROT|nr:hypothetical protein [Sideroxyarcus emersonii]BCK88091.1 hypothetical protein MIZ01_1891 [Sideroxyarcus emersonii]